MLTRSCSLNKINEIYIPNMDFRRERRHSVGGLTGIRNVADVPSPNLRRIDKKENLFDDTLREFINFRSELVYTKIDNYRNIDASNYVSLGAASTVPFNQHGITLDKNGNLTLIKGESHNLIKGLVKKYSTGFEYHSATLASHDGSITPQFSKLFINDHGVLVGKSSQDGSFFSITIKNRPRRYGKVSDREDLEISIKPYKGSQVDNLNFKISDDKTLSFSFEEGKLYLDAIESTNQKLDYSLCAYDVKLPLKKGIKLVSVKKTNNFLQIELQKKDKKRIVYLDPLHISVKKVAARHLSHKPCPSLHGRMGSDPYDKFHPGQPFTSTCFSQFSSPYIPLCAEGINDIRKGLKNAKKAAYKGESKNKIIGEMARGIDPGFRAAVKTIEMLITDIGIRRRNTGHSSKAVFARNHDFLFSNKTELLKLLFAAGVQGDKKQLAASLLQMVDKIAPDDSLTLSFNNSFSGFIGTAIGGVPFNPGWFAGIVGSVMSSHDLMLSPTQEGDIRFSFNNKNTKSVIPLAGTGQGLEKTLLAGSGITYMTVLPLEANMILIANSANSDSFSFALKRENAQELLDSMLTGKPLAGIQSQVIAEAEVKKQAEKNLTVKVECKVEGRLQNGQMINNDFVVLPRLGLGINLSANLLQMNSKQEKTIEGDEVKEKVKVKTVRVAGVEAELFNENTIMPIVLHGENPVHCFPLPLQQEKKSLIRASPSLFHKEKTEVILSENNSALQASENFVVAKALPDALIRQKSLKDVGNLAVIYSANKDNKTYIKELADTADDLSSYQRDIKEIMKSLQQQERQNMGKEVSFHALAHYELIESDRRLRVSLEEEEQRLKSLPDDKVAEKKLKQALATLKKNARYRLQGITIYRNNRLIQKESLKLAILNLTHLNQLELKQAIEKINFYYDNAEAIAPDSITHHATFIH